MCTKSFLLLSQQETSCFPSEKYNFSFEQNKPWEILHHHSPPLLLLTATRPKGAAEGWAL